MISLFKEIILKVQWTFKKKVVFPDISEKRKEIEYYREKFNTTILVETGTFFGDTVEYFKKRFELVISIELSEDLAFKAKHRFENDKNVTILHGDSSKVLATLIPELNSTTLFWLDGHYSSEFFIGDEFIRTAKGESNTPIEKELNIILKSNVNAIILIDDARLFTGKDDYPSIKELENKLKSYKTDYSLFVEKDIIHIVPNKI